MNKIRDFLIGGGTILTAGIQRGCPHPSPAREFSFSNPQSIAHDLMRVAQDVRIASVRHEKEIKQMELKLEFAGSR
jgi:hypothetical protein